MVIWRILESLFCLFKQLNGISSKSGANDHFNVITDNKFPFISAEPDALPSISAASIWLEPLIENYIWQCLPMQINDSSDKLPPWHEEVDKYGRFLWGQTPYGDNVEDEWFVVWLLLEFTRVFPGIAVKLWDNDGNFMLIEAAYSLPRWLKPESAENRVWLHEGHIHLIPKNILQNPYKEEIELHHQRQFKGKTDSISTKTALNAIRNDSAATLGAGTAIEKCILAKLKNYPEQAVTASHRARALIPASIAHILHRNPQTIAACVDAFFNRDPFDVAKLSRRQIQFKPEALVLASVRFNKCLYAQIALQQLHPPKYWPPLPPKEKDGENHEAALLGMKISAGFEILLTKNSAQSNPVGEMDFQSCLERYNSGDYPSMQAMYVDIVQSLMNQPFNMKDLENIEVPASDDDAWLFDAPAIMDAELKRREAEVKAYEAQKRSKICREKDKVINTSNDPKCTFFDPTVLTENIKSFIDTDAGLEGAEIKGSAGTVGLDETKFVNELERVLLSSNKDDGELSNEIIEKLFGNNGAHLCREISEESQFDSSEEVEGSSFYTGSTDEDSSDKDLNDQTSDPRAVIRNSNLPKNGGIDFWDAHTETDSDDDFMNSYADAMDMQLQQSTLQYSFGKKDDANDTQLNRKFQCEAGDNLGESLDGLSLNQTKTALTGESSSVSELQDLRPVDVDTNLVNSLLNSYKEQMGLPGPISNLAGMMGITLPDPKDLHLDNDR